jgi:hypothetical protein
MDKKTLKAILKLSPPKNLFNNIIIDNIQEIVYYKNNRFILYIKQIALSREYISASYYIIYNLSKNIIENSYIDLSLAIDYINKKR